MHYADFFGQYLLYSRDIAHVRTQALLHRGDVDGATHCGTIADHCMRNQRHCMPPARALLNCRSRCQSTVNSGVGLMLTSQVSHACEHVIIARVTLPGNEIHHVDCILELRPHPVFR